MRPHRHSALFRYIEELQGARPWGTMLDAGTGVNSIRWVADLSTARWTAVTCSAGEADRTQMAITGAQRPQDRIVLGNWADAHFLKGECYDTVLAGYLLGAIEGFSPYFQPYLFARLRPLTRGVLYVTGLEPYVPTARPNDTAGRLIWEIGRFRDACMLLAGNMPYREYPAAWAVDHIQRAGFAVRTVKHFAIGHKQSFVNAQIDMSVRALETLAGGGAEEQALARALKGRGAALRHEALGVIRADGALRAGRNYVIAAEPA